MLSEVFENPMAQFFYYRREAVELLGRIGSEATPAVPMLLRTLMDPDSAVRRLAGEALRQIDPEAASVGILEGG